MARDYQKFTALGTVGRERPEMRQAEKGQRVAQFILYTERRWRDASGQSQVEREPHRIVCWNPPGRGVQLADIAERMIRPGVRVFVEGRVHYRQYLDRESGKPVFVTEIIATDLLVEGPPGAGEAYDE